MLPVELYTHNRTALMYLIKDIITQNWTLILTLGTICNTFYIPIYIAAYQNQILYN